MLTSENLARNLQRIRKERGLSLKTFSEEIGIALSSTEVYCVHNG